VVSKFKQRRAFQLTYLHQIRQTFGVDAFQTVIPDLAEFERSVDDAIPVTLHSPSSYASRIARRLFDEFESRIRAHRSAEEHARVSRPRGHARTRTNAPAPAGR